VHKRRIVFYDCAHIVFGKVGKLLKIFINIYMSVVAVRKNGSKVTIGADSIRITGWGTQEKDKLAKLFRISNDMIVGAVGGAAVNSLFREFLTNHLPRENTEYGWTVLMGEFANHLNDLKNAPKFEESAFIVVHKQKVFFLGGYFVREVCDYYAIGAGMDYALAALYMGASVEEAIEAACHLSIFCEKPVNVIEVRK
jgi:ATP-dependent protease HslVU (ClpYQ) peptidase subunit